MKNNKDLHRIVYQLFNKEKWLNEFEIEQDILIQFLQEVQRKYDKNNNSFHNYYHGISVMQGSYALGKLQQNSSLLSSFQRFVLTFSGLCHDVSHPGKTNQFMINSMDKLAIRYNDDSVLERHHAASTFQILQQQDFNIFRNLKVEQFKTLRKEIIENILHTDNSQHFTLIQDFDNIYQPQDVDFDEEEQKIQYYQEKDKDQKILRGMIIHTADFIGASKKYEISKIWSERVNNEFINQYKLEGEMGIPQTPFFKDLDKISVVAKGEAGFFKHIVQPLWIKLNIFNCGQLDQQVKNLDNSIQTWETIFQKNNEQQQKEAQN